MGPDYQQMIGKLLKAKNICYYSNILLAVIIIPVLIFIDIYTFREIQASEVLYTKYEYDIYLEGPNTMLCLLVTYLFNPTMGRGLTEAGGEGVEQQRAKGAQRCLEGAAAREGAPTLLGGGDGVWRGPDGAWRGRRHVERARRHLKGAAARGGGPVAVGGGDGTWRWPDGGWRGSATEREAARRRGCDGEDGEWSARGRGGEGRSGGTREVRGFWVGLTRGSSSVGLVPALLLS